MTLSIRVYFLFSALCLQTKLTENYEGQEFNINGTDFENQVREIIEHFKEPDPVGLPGAPIPDPMPMPNLEYYRSFTSVSLKNGMVHGLSKFRIDQMVSNLADMEVELALKYQKLEFLGNYTMRNLLRKSKGGFNVTLTDVYFEGIANLNIARDGYLEASDIDMDLMFDNIIMDFKNLGFLGIIFQGMVNHLGTYIFNSIKPSILKEVNTNFRGDINKMMKQMKKTFPNSIPPLDLAIAEGRKYIRDNDYDPYKVKDYTYSSGIIDINVNDISFTGLATFYRIGNLTISMTNNTLQIDSHMSTQKLEGKCKWEISLGHLISKYGSSTFTIDYIQVQTKLNQTLDVRNTPKLQELKIKFGNIQLRNSGLGTIDYVLELTMNFLPNILRTQIVDAVAGVLRQRIQTILDGIDVEKNIRRNIQNLDYVIAQNTTNDQEILFDSSEKQFQLDTLYEDIFL